MELQLKNIGMIKEANIKLDGLTVIAGENDTGKSTVGKALFMVLYHINHTLQIRRLKKEEGSISLDVLRENNLLEQSIDASSLPKLIFDNEIIGANINVSYGNSNVDFKINEKNFIHAEKDFVLDGNQDMIYLPVMIETPLVWNFNKFFNQMSTIESHLNILGKQTNINYPFILKDLNFNLSIQSNRIGSLDVKNRICKIINGEFKQDDRENFFFERDKKKISLLNTATGIKAFGIIQVLLENNYLKKNTVLILDEPEVHLHPKWQLEMAKIIVELVKNGIKVLVNSHSPYMIEALERYAEKAKVPADFYLAEDGIIGKVEDNNSKTLAKIFNKLSAPYETFNQMDSETLKGG
ncbi:MAG: ABC transporter, ATP-binding protein [uncultured Sulfurovum sp.]|uniref:ABC transporter, ATP-binding protein n=1 Tax=uncultured Sulfurovum sp. TaxID=269237 RepID=A0A6S6TPN2_9BACT|nr:MAG: ABC transporter, ATP-binding protein [uncultured Sulfurovum sp.]